MIEMPYNLKKIEGVSWEALRELATKELSTIPPNDHIVFEAIFGTKWPQFEQFILFFMPGKATMRFHQLASRWRSWETSLKTKAGN